MRAQRVSSSDFRHAVRANELRVLTLVERAGGAVTTLIAGVDAAITVAHALARMGPVSRERETSL